MTDESIRPPAPKASGPERRNTNRRGLPRRWNDRIWDVRRQYVYGIPLAVLLVFGLFCVWSFWLEPQRLLVRPSDITVAEWPLAKPLKIAVIGDVHGGAPYITPKKLKALVQLTNRQKPDAIVLLGDYVILGVLGGKFMEPEEVASNMAGFHAPLGVYAVLGNHDWWYAGLRMKAALESQGYTVLEDLVVSTEVEGKRLYFAGLGDEWTRRSDPDLVLSTIPKGAPTLVLTHNPDLFPRLPPVLGVTFAAHTHGGQVRLPLMGTPIVPSRYRDKYVKGHVRQGDQHLFVTSGVGTSTLPMRFRTPPEIAIVTLWPDLTRPPKPAPEPPKPAPVVSTAAVAVPQLSTATAAPVKLSTAAVNVSTTPASVKTSTATKKAR